MKVVLLAGGMGSRLSEETEIRPKPMVEIGHRPILWHIMQHYAHFGFRDFIVCLGYRGEYIKKYFSETLAMANDVTIDFAANTVEVLDTPRDDWRVTLVDTGQTTQTAGRLERVRQHLDDESVPDDVRRRCVRRRPRRPRRVPRAGGAAGDRHRRAPARPLRQAADRSRHGARVRGEAADVGGLDQRRLLRPRAGRLRLTSPATSTGRGSRWRAWRPPASSAPTATRASGSAWTRCGTSSC